MVLLPAFLTYYFAMRKLPRLLPATIAAAVLLCGSAVSVHAQADPRNPAMASQRFDNDKDARYARFSEYKKGVSPEQQKRAYQAAKSFLQLYGGDNDFYAKEAKKFVADFEARMYQVDIYAAFDAKNYAKTFEIGRPLLKASPENFFLLGLLAEAGYQNSLMGNTSLNDETIDYLRRAIPMIEAGKVANPEPFKDIETAAGFLNVALGVLAKDKAPAEAAAAYTKAIQPKSPYTNDPLTYYRLGVANIAQYGPLSIEYNDKFGAKQSSPEQRAALEKLNGLVVRALDAYARAVALSDPARPPAVAPATQFTPEFRAKVLAQLTGLYKSLHNDSDAGLSDLISSVLSKPLP